MLMPTKFRATPPEVRGDQGRGGLLAAAYRVDTQEAQEAREARITDDQLEAEMAAIAIEETATEIALRLRGEARRDAATVVARARQRSGQDPVVWDVLGADTQRLIEDLLLRVQGAKLSEIDQAFASGAKPERAAIAASAKVEQALRAKPSGAKPTPQEDPSDDTE